jgi:hypothetical protein
MSGLRAAVEQPTFKLMPPLGEMTGNCNSSAASLARSANGGEAIAPASATAFGLGNQIRLWSPLGPSKGKPLPQWQLGQDRVRPTLVTLTDGTTVPGVMIRARPGSTTEWPAFRSIDDPMGYHEAQQGDQCGRHTLNMTDPGDNLATEDEYRAFLTEKFLANPPQVSDGSEYREATRPEIEELARRDTGASLLRMAEFQAWRRRQCGGEQLSKLVAGNGSVDQPESEALDRVKRDLHGAEVFGVGYQRKNSTAQHNLTIRRINGAFRVYDPRCKELEILRGSSAFEALSDFMVKHAQSVPGFGRAFEYLVAEKEGK